jgi:exodeoxyribonuclease VIII
MRALHIGGMNLRVAESPSESAENARPPFVPDPPNASLMTPAAFMAHGGEQARMLVEEREAEFAKTLVPWNGLHANLPAEIYHWRVLGVASKSVLDRVAKAPASYFAWVNGTEEEEPTEAMEFGKAFHVALLEPARYAAAYAVEPVFGDCRTKGPKAERDAWRKEHAGRIPISAEWAEKITGMIASIHERLPIASKLLGEEGQAEITVRWTDEPTGILCKARADYYVPKRNVAIDVKTTLDASLESFRKSVATFGYHRQDAFYRKGFSAVGAELGHFLFLAIEKTPPYLPALFAIDLQGLVKGEASIREDLETFATCLEKGEWPGYGDCIQTLSLPPWAR